MSGVSSKTITLAHGNGGKLTHDLIEEVFVPAFSTHSSDKNPELREMADSARLPLTATSGAALVFTTDSHVVSPIFFPGGDIGKLSVTGTINDLAVMGAVPLYLSAGFIIEEGYPLSELKRIVASMAEAAHEASVKIVTGDTKVVNKGAADGVFINTSGIGRLLPHAPLGPKSFQAGDVVIVSGSMGDHGIAIYAGREGIDLQTTLLSDVAWIGPLVQAALEVCPTIRVMRDPTRGGLATTLNEFVNHTSLGLELDEKTIPIREEVRGVCEILGFDPLYVANEGKLVLVVPAEASEKVLHALRAQPLGKDAAVIGKITATHPGRVTLRTLVGGTRILDMLVGDMLPRIC